MNKVILVSMLVLVASVWGRPADDEDFDKLDVDEILASERLVNNYIGCAKKISPCTKEGLKLRELVPKTLKNKCADCSEERKAKVYKILEWMIQNRPDDFLEIETMYDKEHVYRGEFADELKSRNIVLPPLKS
ncbi:hypothetical protein PPYR_01890 [Photinus pyralis]|uniref:Uncharacterized protein n=1 Tax=Photinus pyralis TaxID=7054 RepID=A0A1Y1MLZ9_PHOPY|nr:allergen Tha p 1-like [Photinus pyralis]KAB0804920.1 hypothetical protein PPYR_01890 [Photinus pyralis]